MSFLTISATDIFVPVCSKMPLLYLLTQKVAQKFCYVLGIKGKIKTITTDNGVEFAAQEIISKSLGVPVYFADPYSSWQKGAIENATGLVRQYIPKSAAFSNFSQHKITKFTAKINERPRKKLNFSTPKECFYKNIS